MSRLETGSVWCPLTLASAAAGLMGRAWCSQPEPVMIFCMHFWQKLTMCRCMQQWEKFEVVAAGMFGS